MKLKELNMLHAELDKLTVHGKDKDGYTLICYADVAVMLDKVFNKFED